MNIFRIIYSKYQRLFASFLKVEGGGDGGANSTKKSSQAKEGIPFNPPAYARDHRKTALKSKISNIPCGRLNYPVNLFVFPIPLPISKSLHNNMIHKRYINVFFPHIPLSIFKYLNANSNNHWGGFFCEFGLRRLLCS